MTPRTTPRNRKTGAILAISIFMRLLSVDRIHSRFARAKTKRKTAKKLYDREP